MIILVGKSGSGKSAIRDCLIDTYGYKKAISCTTRSPRIEERNGIDYFFLSKKEFLDKIRNDEFAESASYNGEFYGILKTQINDNVVGVVEPKGAKNLKQLFKEKAVIFEIWASKETRIERMRQRGDKELDIATKIEMDEIVFNDTNTLYNYWSPNEALNNIDIVAHSIHKLYTKDIQGE